MAFILLQIYQIYRIWNNLDKIKRKSAPCTPPLHLYKPIRLTIFVYEEKVNHGEQSTTTLRNLPYPTFNVKHFI